MARSFRDRLGTHSHNDTLFIHIVSLEAEPIKAQITNLHEIKVAFDDAVVKYMVEEAGYIENHYQMDVKLVVAFVLNVIGSATGYYAFKTPFEQSKFWTAVGAAVFLVIYGIWNLYSMLSVQFVFVGKKDTGKAPLVRLRSVIQLADPTYRLYASSAVGEREILSKGVDNWVTEDGFLAARPFVSDMHTAVQKIESVKKD